MSGVDRHERHVLPPAAAAALVRTSRVLAWARIGGDARLREGNTVLARAVGRPEEGLPGTPITELLTAEDGVAMLRRIEGDQGTPGPFLANFVTARDQVHTLSCMLFPDGTDRILVGEPDVEDDRALAEELLRLNNELSVVSRENIRRSRELEAARAELQATLKEREDSYWHLRKIQEVLPVCMGCSRLKTGDSEWKSLVDYLKANEIFVSHGYCPSCALDFSRELGE